MRFLNATIKAKEAISIPSDADCCVYIQNVLTHVYGLAPATPELLALWRIFRDRNDEFVEARRWGPVLAAEQVGIGKRLVDGPIPGQWHLVQRWMGARGHTFLWLAGQDGYGWVHESDRSGGPRSNGPVTWESETGHDGTRVEYAVLRRPVKGS